MAMGCARGRLKMMMIWKGAFCRYLDLGRVVRLLLRLLLLRIFGLWQASKRSEDLLQIQILYVFVVCHSWGLVADKN